MSITPVGTRLRELRSIKGVSQDTVSLSVGISRVALTRYENGDRTPTTDIATRLAEYYGVSVDYLLCHENKDHPNEQEIISDDEVEILKLFRQCNEKDRARAAAYLEGLIAKK